MQFQLLTAVWEKEEKNKNKHVDEGDEGESVNPDAKDWQNKENSTAYLKEACELPNFCVKVALFLIAWGHNQEHMLAAADLSTLYAHFSKCMAFVLMGMSWWAVCDNRSSAVNVFLANKLILMWIIHFHVLEMFLWFDCRIWQYLKENGLKRDFFANIYIQFYNAANVHFAAMSIARDMHLFGFVACFLSCHALLQCMEPQENDSDGNITSVDPGVLLTRLWTTRHCFEPMEKMKRSMWWTDYRQILQHRPVPKCCLRTAYCVNISLVLMIGIYRTRFCLELEFSVCALRMFTLDLEMYLLMAIYAIWLLMWKQFVLPMNEAANTTRQEICLEAETKQRSLFDFSVPEKVIVLAWVVFCTVMMLFAALILDWHGMWLSDQHPNAEYDHWGCVASFLLTITWSARHTGMVMLAIAVHVMTTRYVSDACHHLPASLVGKVAQTGVLVGRPNLPPTWFIATDQPVKETET